MFIKQISVLLKNKTGALAELTALLLTKAIAIFALTIVESEEYGTLRMVVSDPELALTLLKDADYAAAQADVFAVLQFENATQLADLFILVQAHNINVEYLYAFNRSVEGAGVVVFRTNLPIETRELLLQHNIKTVSQARLQKMDFRLEKNL